MNDIKQWAVYLCVALIISLIFSILTPNSKLDGGIKFIIGLFIMTSLTVPILPKISSISVSSNVDISSDYKNKLNDTYKTIIQKNLSEKIKSQLKSNDIKINNIDLNINILSDKSISISNLTIYIDKKYQAKEGEIINIINNLVNTKPEIKFS